MFRTVPLSIIRSLWHTIAVCTVPDSWWWIEELSETCRILFQDKFEKLMHLAGFIIRIISILVWLHVSVPSQTIIRTTFNNKMYYQLQSTTCMCVQIVLYQHVHARRASLTLRKISYHYGEITAIPLTDSHSSNTDNDRIIIRHPTHVWVCFINFHNMYRYKIPNKLYKLLTIP